MKSPITSRIGAVGLAAATVLASGLVTLAGAVPGVGSAAEAATAGSLTITPNPAAAGQPFQGWGTSLAWFANATGDYPAALRNQL